MNLKKLFYINNRKYNYAMKLFRDIHKYSEYIKTSAFVNLKVELADFRLGWLWWILGPMLDLLLYAFVYTVVFHKTLQYAVAFIMMGIAFWRFFQQTTQSSVSLIKRNKSVISRVYIPKLVLILSLIISNFYKFLFSLIPLVLLMIIYKIPVSIHTLSVIPITMILIIWIFGISCFCLHIGVYIADFNKMVTIILKALFYFSGVFYSLLDINNRTISTLILNVNPIAQILFQSRNAVLYGIPCVWNGLLVQTMVAIVIAYLGCLTIYKHEGEYTKLV